MKVAVIGSRNIIINNIEAYLPKDITEIVSGGARGIDTYAAEYAKKTGYRWLNFCLNTAYTARVLHSEEICKLLITQIR